MIIHGAKPRSEPEIIKARLAELAEAFAMVSAVLHKCDGTQADSPFGLAEFRTAHQHLSTAWLWAKEAVETN
jgi:hypothetical protein